VPVVRRCPAARASLSKERTVTTPGLKNRPLFTGPAIPSERNLDLLSSYWSIGAAG
jgi:hypothetical protein